MSELKLTGKLIAIMDKHQVTDTFAKRDFVIETDEQYPQQVKFELMDNKCEDIDKHKVGSEITVHFNVRGRSWKNKQGETVYFVSLNAWRIEAEAAQEDNFPQAQCEPPVEDNFANDLPF